MFGRARALKGLSSTPYSSGAACQLGTGTGRAGCAGYTPPLPLPVINYQSLNSKVVNR